MGEKKREKEKEEEQRNGEEKDNDVVPTFIGILCHLPGSSLLLPLNHRSLSSLRIFCICG